MRKKLWLTLAGIIVLVGLAAVVDYPKGPNITWQGKLVRELKVQLGLDLQGGTSLVYQADTAQVTPGEEAEAMAGVRDVLENRINAFGVSEPIIQTNQVSGNWRVLVELPGVTDLNEAIKQIGETPLLEFKVEGDQQTLSEEQLKIVQQLNDQTKQQAQDVLEQLKQDGDFSALAKAKSQDEATASTGGEVDYVDKATLPQSLADAVANNENELNKVLPDLIETDTDYQVVKVVDRKDDNQVKYAHIVFKKIPATPDIFGPNYVNTQLTGKQLAKAMLQFDSTTNAPVVALTFNDEGAKLFEQITKENINKTVAIYLDGEAISTPVVNEAITGGQAVISGKFTLDEAKQLVRRLNAGALPVKITLVNQRNVGPTLGVEALQRSVLAGIIAMLVLGVFMIAYYRFPGLIAMIALSMYGLMLLAIFKLWPVTLTLSGIAGFILSLGMAVDANVLIFERLKEELRSGKNLQSAIDEGFKRAWLSIRDSNVSSLITCMILSWFGTAMIKGFAITLALGIILSLFSAITITRTLLKILAVKNIRWYGVNRKDYV